MLTTDVGWTIVEDDIEGGTTVLIHELLDAHHALWPRDVFLDGECAEDWGTGCEVDATLLLRGST